MDLCSYAGHDYLVIVDCYTDWPAIISMEHDTTAPQLITALRQSFWHTAIPDVLWSDGGPQFTSKIFYTKGLYTQDIYSILPSKQWKNRGYSEVYEEDQPIIMEWQVHGP